jgi:hypothetical protein
VAASLTGLEEEDDDDEDAEAVWDATQGVAGATPFPTRLGFDCTSEGKALDDDDDVAVPQEEAAAERPERAVELLSLRTRLAVVGIEADCEEAPAMGG